MIFITPKVVFRSPLIWLLAGLLLVASCTPDPGTSRTNDVRESLRIQDSIRAHERLKRLQRNLTEGQGPRIDSVRSDSLQE